MHLLAAARVVGRFVPGWIRRSLDWWLFECGRSVAGAGHHQTAVSRVVRALVAGVGDFGFAPAIALPPQFCHRHGSVAGRLRTVAARLVKGISAGTDQLPALHRERIHPLLMVDASRGPDRHWRAAGSI